MVASAGFAPLSDDQWPASLARLKDGWAGRLNVYRAMAHHPALVTAWEGLRNHVVLDSALGPARSEVVILRTGHRCGSAYEWAHHVVRGRACGLSDERIETLRGTVSGMAPEDRPLARAVDELVDDSRLGATTVTELVSQVGREGVLDVIATVGMYMSLAFITNSFDVPLEAVIPGKVGR